MIVQMNTDILNGYIKHKLSTINIVYSLKMFYYSPTPPPNPQNCHLYKTGATFFSVPKVTVVERFDCSILFYFILPKQPKEANKALIFYQWQQD